MKKLIYIIAFMKLISCSNQDSVIENQETFVDQGISLYADENPNNDVMMQAFWWDSYSDLKLSNFTSYYEFIQSHIINLSNSYIDLIWLPPPSEGEGMGYHPRRLFNFTSEHGSEQELKNLISLIRSRKMHAMADLVLNHRIGSLTWTDFTEPTWSCNSICVDDESSTDPNAFGTEPCGDLDEGMSWGGARDLNHKSEEVQLGLKEYLLRLKEIGFDSWRYDFVKGFPAKYVGEYNKSTDYYFSVGEFWDGNLNSIKQWIDKTEKTVSEIITRKSAAFDFTLKYKLKEALVNKNYTALEKDHSLSSLDGYGNRSITFLDNHDTGCINRTDCDNLYSKNLNLIASGYAYILTHPGIPMVWGYHYFFSDPSENLKTQINELIKIRKQKGINALSKTEIIELKNGSSGFYVAEIDGKILVKIGEGLYTVDNSWNELLKGENYIIYSK
jgi:glycosidase